MPVSPQDFALWSQHTGNPYPRTPAERMSLAPHVYEYTRNINQGRPMSGVRKLVDVAGKAALGLGALAGAAYLGQRFLGDDGGSSPPSPSDADITTTAPQGPSIGQKVQSFLKGVDLDEGAPTSNPLPLDPDIDLGSVATGGMGGAIPQGDVTPPTTAQTLNQGGVSAPTQAIQELKGSGQAPSVTPEQVDLAAQNKVLASHQNPVVGEAVEMIGGAAAKAEAFRKSKAYQVMKEEYPGLRDIESPTAPSSVAPVSLTNVQPAQAMGVATQAPSPIDVGSALKAKGIYLSGDPSSGEVTVNTEKGGSYLIEHPYSSHPKEGIRQTALQEEQLAKGVLQSAGVTPEQAKSYWTSKFSKQEESPIAAMTTAGAPMGREHREVHDTLLKYAPGYRTATPEAQEHMRNVALKRSGGGTAVATAPVPVVVEARAPVAAPQATITPNEYLSKMSQKHGPLASYAISPERSSSVTELNFYPGGELGVTMGSKRGDTEYAYATSDPYRLAMRDYAEEGFPESMGNIGSIAANQGIAHQMGLQQAVEKGGGIRQTRKPAYGGLMGDDEITSIVMQKARNKTQQRAMELAQRHFETKEVMRGLEERAAARRAGLV